MLQFPDNPQPGDMYLSYIWDGSKWSVQAGVGGVAGVASFNARVGQIVTTLADVTAATGIGAAAQGNLGLAKVAATGSFADLTGMPPWAIASTTPPAMDGVATPGVALTYSPGDHIHPTDTSRAAELGVTDASNAAAGHVGEFLSVTVLKANAVAAATGVVIDVANIPLPAGDWDVQGQIWVSPAGSAELMAATQCTGIAAWVSQTAGAIPTIPAGSLQSFFGIQIALTATYLPVLTSGRVRFSTKLATAIHLGGVVTYTGAGPLGLYGFIGARRMR